ncbi:hypothetical protein GCM10009111_29830 [Colwellia asteriadis]|uniref:Uncharacterized protein n=1 Tax=Colwellia asteriadis TaxID=517723 RepID=A0ABN1LB50_9GAMM
MKLEHKAVLLSALLYPGSGHVFLKKYFIGLSFISAFTFLLYNLFSTLNRISEKVALQITNGEIALTIEAISQAVTVQLAKQPPQYNWLGYALLFIWLFAMFDAYRLAKVKKKTFTNKVE